MMDKYKIEWIPQLPLKDGTKPFEVFVDTLEEAINVSNLLGRYDIYQYETNIKPDFANAGSILEYDKECKGWAYVDDDVLEDNQALSIPDGTY